MQAVSRRAVMTGLAAGMAGVALGATEAEAAGLVYGFGVGARGAKVSALQARLRALGYWVPKADGIYGELTKQGVLAVQKAARLPRTGYFDGATAAKLNAGFKPVARYRTAGQHIEVDKARQILLLVRNGVTINTAATSTAGGYYYYSGGHRYFASTPSGSFRIYRLWPSGWKTSALGVLYRPAYFTGGYAIHGETEVPAYPASHGCVRVTPAFMDQLWANHWVPLGMQVRLY